jgi:hypothetical protein
MMENLKQEDHDLGKKQNLISKIIRVKRARGDMAQEVVCLPRRGKPLSSSPILPIMIMIITVTACLVPIMF